MSCGCDSQKTVQSWNDLLCQVPTDPRNVLAIARLGATPGDWFLSANYHRPLGVSVWIPTPIAYASEALVTTNASDQQQMVFDAASWNQGHLTVNVDAATAPPLRKMLFARAGESWTNAIPLAMGSSPQFTELQLSILENAATRGDAQGTIPVFRWASGPYSGFQTLNLSFKQPGRYTFGLMGINNNSTPDYSMFEMDIIVR